MAITTVDLSVLSAPLTSGTEAIRLGAYREDGVTHFRVWAPACGRVELKIHRPDPRRVEMTPQEGGYFALSADDIAPGAEYSYVLDGDAERPDPASRLQADGVHGPSVVLERTPPQRAGWDAIDLHRYVIYELHVGTFTREGTLDAVIPHLDRLRELGITAIELMPLADFPGNRNWGYDGVLPFAVHRSYGGPEALRRVVHACHERGLALILDVVYNHLGPEGNYLRDFGPYFTSRYTTPWGEAINFDGAGSDHVREYFIQNALYWVEEFGIDALRLDAVHAIYDHSAYPFLEELADRVHRCASDLGRSVFLIAESDLNDSRVVRSKYLGGYGLDAQWADDFHHCVHTLLTGEKSGYYQDFGSLEQFGRVLREGWAYAGEYSKARGCRFGNSPAGIEPHRLVVCSQNHDQVGNRRKGDRLIDIAGPEKAKLAAAAVILSPYTPLLFMGEEYGEPAPFQYFVSHTDPGLRDAVREGRNQEFAAFAAHGEAPDPNAESTFESSRLSQELALTGPHAEMHRYYQQLLRIRATHPAFRNASRDQMTINVDAGRNVIWMERHHREGSAIVLLNFSESDHAIEVPDSTSWHVVAGPQMINGRTALVPRWSCTVLSSVAMN